MRLTKASFEILNTCPWEVGRTVKFDESWRLSPLTLTDKPSKEALLNAAYRMVEKAGRTCYKSEDKITETSAKAFVDRMIASKHYAMLEHGTVYMTMGWSGQVCQECNQSVVIDDMQKFLDNPYCKCEWQNNLLHITTNLRVIAENNWWSDLEENICTPTTRHIRRISVKFSLSRQIAMEFIRHRVFSFAMESTRYCNYSNQKKFNGELTFIEPCWDYTNSEFNTDYSTENTLLYTLETIETNYLKLLEDGWKPQQAAVILPNMLKADLVMTGFIEDWKHFFALRSLGLTGAPHPQAKELAEPLMKEFINRKYINSVEEITL